MLGLGRQDVIRSNGWGLDDSVWLSMEAGAFHDAMGLPVLPVLDASVMGVQVIKVSERKTRTVNHLVLSVWTVKGVYDVNGCLLSILHPHSQ